MLKLTAENYEKIVMSILSFIHKGSFDIVIYYEFENFRVPITKITSFISPQLFRIIALNNVRLYLVGFPRCVFDRFFLRNNYLSNLKGEIIFLEENEVYDGNKNFKKNDLCMKCKYFDNCKGFDINYQKKFGSAEFRPIISNTNRAVLIRDYINCNFENQSLISIANRVLEDYENEEFYMRKRFVFCKSFPDNLDESSNQRFIYYIDNIKSEFEKDFSFLKDILNIDLITQFDDLIRKSSQMVFSFAVMGDGFLRKSFYFALESATDEDISILEDIIGVSLNRKNFWGVGVDLKNDNISYKIYNMRKSIEKRELISFVNECQDLKGSSFDIIMVLFPNKINEVLLDEKYRDGILYSRRVDLSCQYNKINVEKLFQVIGFNKKDYDIDLYTLSFEFANNKEKVNLYFTLFKD